MMSTVKWILIFGIVGTLLVMMHSISDRSDQREQVSAERTALAESGIDYRILSMTPDPHRVGCRVDRGPVVKYQYGDRYFVSIGALMLGPMELDEWSMYVDGKILEVTTCGK